MLYKIRICPTVFKLHYCTVQREYSNHQFTTLTLQLNLLPYSIFFFFIKFSKIKISLCLWNCLSVCPTNSTTSLFFYFCQLTSLHNSYSFSNHISEQYHRKNNQSFPLQVKSIVNCKGHSNISQIIRSSNTATYRLLLFCIT